MHLHLSLKKTCKRVKKRKKKLVTQTCVLYQGNSPRWIYVTLVQIKGKMPYKHSPCSPGHILASSLPGGLSWRLEGVFSWWLSLGNPSDEASWGKWYTSAACITFPIFRSQIRFGHCFHYQQSEVSELLPSQIHQDTCHSSLAQWHMLWVCRLPLQAFHLFLPLGCFKWKIFCAQTVHCCVQSCQLYLFHKQFKTWRELSCW